MSLVSRKYFYIDELPEEYIPAKVVHVYWKGIFTWLVKEIEPGLYFHYCRLISGRLLYKFTELPF